MANECARGFCRRAMTFFGCVMVQTPTRSCDNCSVNRLQAMLEVGEGGDAVSSLSRETHKHKWCGMGE